MAKKKKIRHVQPLFIRISIYTLLPVLTALILLACLIITNESEGQRQHERYLAITATQLLASEASATIDSAGTALDVSLQNLRQNLSHDSGALSLDLIDPAKGLSLFTYQNLNKSAALKSPAPIPTDEILQIQKSLSLMRDGTPYHLNLEGSPQELCAYIPFRHPNTNQFVVAVGCFPYTAPVQTLIQTSRLLLIAVLISVLVALAFAFALSFHIVRPVLAMNRACREILEGNLGKRVLIKSGDEIELLASSFNRMSQAMLITTHAAGDANPLTQLPGNQIIREEVNRRINDDMKFVFFHADIDHFKAFNDEYGLAKGDDVLRHTAHLLTQIAKEVEGQSFVGHQGGDDFILVLEVSQAERIAKAVCSRFDESLKDFYSAEDLARGYFLGKDARSYSISDEGELKRQPLMSISLAGISNAKRPYHSFEDVLEHSINVKKRAKKLPYSVYLIEE